MGLSDVGIDLRAGPFSTDNGIVDLHPSKRTHWVVYKNETFFDSYGCSPPQKLSKFIVEHNGHCLYSEYKIQVVASIRNSYCASYCLYTIYCTKIIGIVFKSAVLNLHYQMIK